MNEIKDSDYIAQIVDIRNYTDSKSRPVVEWSLLILGGEHDQEIVSKRHYLTSNKSVEFLKKELAMVGISTNSREDFEAQREKANGMKIRIQATTNDHGFVVYYLKGIVKSDDVVRPNTKNIGW